MDSVVIIIPTTGAPTLFQCLSSAVEQDWSNTHILVVIDGPQFEQSARSQIAAVSKESSKKTNILVMTLPYNTGANGWYGHRIYAAANFLVDQDWIFYLDQDNWFDINHVSSQIESCKMQAYAWGHSLRKICDVSGNYLLDDNCESLGKYPTYVDSNSHLVDTSAFCIRRDVAIQCGAAWHGQWGADRQFLHNINHFYPNWGGTGKYTLNYRLAGNPGSVTQEFFEIGNRVMKERYPDQFPWNEWRITI